MITLTTPSAVKSVLGNTTTVAYDKLVLAPLTFDPVGQTISGTVRMTSTSVPAMQPIQGTFRASVPLSEFVIEVPLLDFYRRIVTSSAQNNAILAQIQTAQNAVESGLITLAVIAGVQSNGA